MNRIPPNHYHCPIESCVYGVPAEPLQNMFKKHIKTKSLLKQHYVKVHGLKNWSSGRCNEPYRKPSVDPTCDDVFTCDCGLQYLHRESLNTHCRRKGHQFPSKYQRKLRTRGPGMFNQFNWDEILAPVIPPKCSCVGNFSAAARDDTISCQAPAGFDVCLNGSGQINNSIDIYPTQSHSASKPLPTLLPASGARRIQAAQVQQSRTPCVILNFHPLPPPNLPLQQPVKKDLQQLKVELSQVKSQSCQTEISFSGRSSVDKRSLVAQLRAKRRMNAKSLGSLKSKMTQETQTARPTKISRGMGTRNNCQTQTGARKSSSHTQTASLKVRRGSGSGGMKRKSISIQASSQNSNITMPPNDTELLLADLVSSATSTATSSPPPSSTPSSTASASTASSTETSLLEPHPVMSTPKSRHRPVSPPSLDSQSVAPARCEGSYVFEQMGAREIVTPPFNSPRSSDVMTPVTHTILGSGTSRKGSDPLLNPGPSMTVLVPPPSSRSDPMAVDDSNIHSSTQTSFMNMSLDLDDLLTAEEIAMMLDEEPITETAHTQTPRFLQSNTQTQTIESEDMSLDLLLANMETQTTEFFSDMSATAASFHQSSTNVNSTFGSSYLSAVDLTNMETQTSDASSFLDLISFSNVETQTRFGPSASSGR